MPLIDRYTTVDGIVLVREKRPVPGIGSQHRDMCALVTLIWQGQREAKRLWKRSARHDDDFWSAALKGTRLPWDRIGTMQQ